MTDHGVTESAVEQAALAWLEAIGWRVAHGPDVAPGTLTAERCDYGEVVPQRSAAVRNSVQPTSNLANSRR